MSENILIMTDSNSGITQAEAKSLGIRVIPMPFYIDGELFYEGVDLTHEEFFEKQNADADITTSQPSPASLAEAWEEALGSYDRVIYMPMSSGLSSACATAQALARDYEGRVTVVDNRRISVPLRFAVCDAVEMANAGMTADKITEVLMRESLEASVYITVDTLKYLKKGGRLTPAAAAFGTVLNIKPVLQIQGGKLDAFAKVRGMKSAKKTMLEALEADLKGRFAGKKVRLAAAHTCSPEEALTWKREIEDYFSGMGDVAVDPLTLSVACHTGAGALGIGCCHVVEY